MHKAKGSYERDPAVLLEVKTMSDGAKSLRLVLRARKGPPGSIERFRTAEKRISRLNPSADLLRSFLPWRLRNGLRSRMTYGELVNRVAGEVMATLEGLPCRRTLGSILDPK